MRGTVFVDSFSANGLVSELGFMSSNGFKYIIGKNTKWSCLESHVGEFIEAVGVVRRFEEVSGNEVVFIVQNFITKNEIYHVPDSESIEFEDTPRPISTARSFFGLSGFNYRFAQY